MATSFTPKEEWWPLCGTPSSGGIARPTASGLAAVDAAAMPYRTVVSWHRRQPLDDSMPRAVEPAHWTEDETSPVHGIAVFSIASRFSIGTAAGQGVESQYEGAFLEREQPSRGHPARRGPARELHRTLPAPEGILPSASAGGGDSWGHRIQTREKHRSGAVS